MTKNVLIVGGGQVGGSVALGHLARGNDYAISVLEQNKANANKLEKRTNGQASITTNASSLKDHKTTPNIVMLSTEIGQFENALEAIIGNLPAGTVLTDTGSAKVTSIAHIEKILTKHGRDDIHFIPAHPGYGVSGQGPDTSSPDMYEGKAVFVIQPEEKASNDKLVAFDTIKNYWADLGADVVEIDATSHDMFFGTTSHFEHTIVFALMMMAIDDEGGLKDGFHNSRTFMSNLTRIARANPKMWVSILDENKEALFKAKAGFADKMAAITQAMHVDTPDQLKALLNQAHSYRKSMTHDEKREGISGEIHDWAEEYGVQLKEHLPSTEELSQHFNDKSRSDFVLGTMLPTLLAAGLTLNAKDIDENKVKNISIAAKANPSFLDGTAPMLSNPDYIADLLFAFKDDLAPALQNLSEQLNAVTSSVESDNIQQIDQTIRTASFTRGHMQPPRKPQNGMRELRNEHTLTFEAE